MKSFYAIGTIVLMLALPGSANADTVVLKDGSRVTGTVVNFDGKVLTLKTDFAEDLKVQWTAVTAVTSVKPLYVVTSDNHTVSGVVSTEGSDLVIQQTNQPAVRVPLTGVKTIRSEEQQTAYEKSLHPNLIHNWAGSADFGLALARGNSETTNLNIGFNAVRKTLSDQITSTASSVYASDNAPGGGVTANAVLGSASYDKNITKRLFGFASANYTHDALQDLNLRSIYTGGLGWHAIANSTTVLDVLFGINYTRETYSAGTTSTGVTTGVNRNLPGLTAGENFTRKFGQASVLSEQLSFYPDLDDLSQYRFTFNTTMTTKLSKWLAWQVSFSDWYVTDPPILGTKPNDLIFSTGLNVNFSH